MLRSVLLVMAMAAAVVPAAAQAQSRPNALLAETRSFGEEQGGRAVGRPTSPVIRTAATIAASAGGFAYAQSRIEADPDDLLVPMAAGVLAGAVAGIAFSNAHPVKVVFGSLAATLPAAGLAHYLAVLLEDDRSRIPLVAFSVPHGLITSAMAQNRR
jgi:hypothetical protein